MQNPTTSVVGESQTTKEKNNIAKKSGWVHSTQGYNPTVSEIKTTLQRRSAHNANKQNAISKHAQMTAESNDYVNQKKWNGQNEKISVASKQEKEKAKKAANNAVAWQKQAQSFDAKPDFSSTSGLS